MFSLELSEYYVWARYAAHRVAVLRRKRKMSALGHNLRERVWVSVGSRPGRFAACSVLANYLPRGARAAFRIAAPARGHRERGRAL